MDVASGAVILVVEGERAFGVDTLLAEYHDYIVRCPGADLLRVGSTEQRAIAPGLFPVRFESAVGVTSFQAFAQGRALTGLAQYEVVSTKLGSLGDYRQFAKALSDDVFARATGYLFRLSEAPTGRATARGAVRNVIFSLHFFLENEQRILDAFRAVTERPHVSLGESLEPVALAQVTTIDADLLAELSAPRGQTFVPADPALEKLLKRLPVEVWARQGRETTDTPENRFALWLLEHLRGSVEAVLTHSAAPKIPADRQRRMRDLTRELTRLSEHPVFDEVGTMNRLPIESRVLTRREGYRDLFPLFDAHELGRSLLFDSATRAIEQREIWRLYEVWVFFELIERISRVLGREPVLQERHDASEDSGLAEGTRAKWEGLGELLYNRERNGYALRMKPDYLWTGPDQVRVAFDAKYRAVGRADVEEAGLDVDADSLNMMHAYRDGLGLPAAVAVYVGTKSGFYYSDAHDRRAAPLPALDELLRGEHRGIGKWALRPSLQGEKSGQSGS